MEPIPTIWTDPASPYRVKGQPGLWFNGFSIWNDSSRRSIHDVRFVYFIEFQESMVKVGLADDVEARLEGFRLGCPRGLVLKGSRRVPAHFSRQVERRIHDALDEWADGREWFSMRAAEAKRIADPILRDSWKAHRMACAAGVRFDGDRAAA